MFTIEQLEDGRSEIARAILASLPQWFGRPASVDAYVAAADDLPMLAARTPDGVCVGFLSLKVHTAVAAEAYVLGVAAGWHRKGIGRALFESAALYLTAKSFRYLTVKTLAASHPDPHYAMTRQFYEAIGFEPLEVFSTLWDADTPCLLMVMPLAEQELRSVTATHGS